MLFICCLRGENVQINPCHVFYFMWTFVNWIWIEKSQCSSRNMRVKVFITLSATFSRSLTVWLPASSTCRTSIRQKRRNDCLFTSLPTYMHNSCSQCVRGGKYTNIGEKWSNGTLSLYLLYSILRLYLQLTDSLCQILFRGKNVISCLPVLDPTKAEFSL